MILRHIVCLLSLVVIAQARLIANNQFQHLQTKQQQRSTFFKTFNHDTSGPQDTTKKEEQDKDVQSKPLSAVEFRQCRDRSPAPLSVSVACDDRVRDTCSIARGLNHTVRVTFDPKRDSSLVRSAISWRTWVEMPVPAQDSAACNYMSCPIRRGQRTTFSYNLNMPTYVMRRRHSLIWRLIDMDTQEVLLCFSFRTHVT